MSHSERIKIDLNASYNPQEIESKIYKNWESSNAFEAGQYVQTDSKFSGEPFAIQFPPPNVTGFLHMGHAFNQTIMDGLVRYYRMNGSDTVYIPGSDHAGIATQIVVERQLDAEGVSRHDLGREKFLERVWDWKNISGGTIHKQIRKLGSSADWSREYFTMDDQMSKGVIETFVRLYEQGLIYRGKRLVNWDPVLGTAISDLEVENSEEDGHMWHIRYPLTEPVDSTAYLVVATTRPETMLGDVAVMVHPEDERYKHLIGKFVSLPLTSRQIPIIADEYVDMEFGTGVVKVTPAHDFNDNAVGQRHGLEQINIFTLDAHINENAPEKYRGLDRFDARKAVVADLELLGLLQEVKPHKLMVPRGDRTKTVIEPMLTDQWYVAMTKPAPEGTFNPGKSITEVALEVVKKGEVKFYPENWTNTYNQWLENIQDWCISRQLWWGHQIPAWYGENGEIFVARNEEEAQQKASDSGYRGVLRRDEDVLDTWFSSALVPFTTMGWPEETDDYKKYLPSNVLVTGFDIIFFWVARMIMMSMHLTGQIPFKVVYVHGLILDAHGQKMSKSKGNTINPEDLIDGVDLETLVNKRTQGLMNPKQASKIEKETRKDYPNGINAYGTDALRFTMATYATLGRNMNFDLKRCEGYRNFCNKLWNASRFVLMNVEDKPIHKYSIWDDDFDFDDIRIVDQWIISEFQLFLEEIHKGFEEYRFDNIANNIYKFVWDEFCDWYLELSKVLLNTADEEEQAITRRVLIDILEGILKVAHPIIPFITEGLWQKVSRITGTYYINSDDDSEKFLCHQAYPHHRDYLIDEDALVEVKEIKETIEAIRALRGEMQISPAQKIDLYLVQSYDMKDYYPYIKSLAKVENIEVVDSLPDIGAPSTILNHCSLMLNVKIDIEAETARLNKEISNLTKEIDKAQGKLNNPNFVQKAPHSVIEQEKARVEQFTALLDKVRDQLSKLK
ncbi:valine--tRNA ligase [Taylorella equigenitalis]|uniref:Valine--tRNA ligase n=2 Tax=Taylorella equigenitalis TaxID=29575 RepID=A0A654KJA7_TAYEM|nr:valine--tRNA ligase [Taylorella equigenitalis]ADU92449.1 Valyl-tRNA synthetase [Taylorella equigenitalis MCE9]AFN35999.1 Valyl-tRNA synthetase [Taylorella equigenitalis ATCC 35865]ASY39413.1 valine--tRNA ligase [Taylorella equigenitalis]WDU55739.1 valine--tRNA ligase [Taylorella equigenitalis]VEG31546.1 Valine--tRNA ligase [Taylorella equigenitalis ATCC 35865]